MGAPLTWPGHQQSFLSRVEHFIIPNNTAHAPTERSSTYPRITYYKTSIRILYDPWMTPDPTPIRFLTRIALIYSFRLPPIQPLDDPFWQAFPNKLLNNDWSNP
jgi:hypothetical protein